MRANRPLTALSSREAHDRAHQQAASPKLNGNLDEKTAADAQDSGWRVLAQKLILSPN
jgi:hypothetical protein